MDKIDHLLSQINQKRRERWRKPIDRTTLTMIAKAGSFDLANPTPALTFAAINHSIIPNEG